MTTKIATYFKTQFPNGDVTETYNDVLFDEEHDRYCKFNLDIGWAMKGGHSNRRADKNGDRIRKYDRICCGYFTCENENCRVYNLPRRPPVKKNAVCKELNEGCKYCSGALVHKPCLARVNSAMDEYMEKNPTLQPKAATVGIDSRTGTIIASTREIDPILGNRERTRYETRKAKERMNMTSLDDDPVKPFMKINNTYPGYLTAASVLPDLVLISFQGPSMPNCARISMFPIATDVTYKAVGSYYLCSSLIYSIESRRHVVIFQAILDRLTETSYQHYFTTLFSAFQIYSGREEHEGLRYLKGCYMYWMQSVQRVSSNHNVVLPENRQRFLDLTYTIRVTCSNATLNQCIAIMINEFPGSRRWIRWWLQPKIRSMIFNSQSLMKPALRTHSIRTGNACENYHSILYRNMPKKMLLISALNCLLKFAANDEEDIRQFYEHGILPTYNHTPRTQPNSRFRSTYYQASDSRPPDHNAVLFAEESEDERENDEPQQIKQLELPIAHLMVPNNDDLQNVCDNEIGVAHMVENDCLTLQADDPIVVNILGSLDDNEFEKIPSELMSIFNGDNQYRDSIHNN
ncbi:hypothetical protein INT45_012332 [Circinella minor]|uniref:Uncharacterized protein n=1 Tax=Circinella minor TaxID=1195481 RepID=A0A8H7S159_9FUNG|nr:hypothetical protein INT45_012332 [Circinella minor]